MKPSNLHTSQESHFVETLPACFSTSLCLLDRIYTAGCYTNLSYIFSRLHPDTMNSILNEDTRLLIQTHQETVIDVYDNVIHPTVGAIIVPFKSEVIIAFHGTNFDRKEDHITNFEARLMKSDYSPGFYHSGFLRLSNNIVPEIIKVLHQYYDALTAEQLKIHIYGHSMGAGLAQLLTQYLQHQYQELSLETIVFGSPKVMCPVAAKAYDQRNQSKTIRVENPLDLAIYMPTQFMGYGVVNNAILLPNTYSDMMRNHGIEGYLESILKLRQQFRDQGVTSVSLEDYITASAKFNPIHSWMPYAHHRSKNSSFSEFMQLLGHGLSRGIQSIIRALPFK